MPKTKAAWFAAAVIVVLFAKTALYYHFYTAIPVDFKSFYLAGKGLLALGNVYDFAYIDGLAKSCAIPETVYPYLYPPVMAFYFAPFSRLSPLAASHLWELLNLMLYVFIIAQSMRLASVLTDRKDDQNRTPLILLSGILFLALPFDYNFIMGQSNAIVLALIILSLIQALERGHDAWAGFLLAPAVLIKITPIFLLVFFLVNRRFRTLLGFLGGLILFTAPMLFFKAGVSAWGHFLEFLPALSFGKTLPGLFPLSELANFSFAGFFARLTQDRTVARTSTYVLLFILSAALIYRHWKLSGKPGKELLLLPYFILMVLASPLAYLHHVIYLYPALLIVSYRLLCLPGKSARVLLLLILGAALTAGVDLPHYYERLGAIPAVLKSVNLFMLVLLFFIGLALPGIVSAAIPYGNTFLPRPSGGRPRTP